jgi:protein Mpv17
MSKSANPPAAQPPPSSSSQLYRVTFEGALLAALSNILAQSFSYYEKGSSAIDPLTFFHFVILSIITTPPNFKWQMWLENTFPGKKAPIQKREETVDEKLGVNGNGIVGTKKVEEGLGGLSIKNTAIKFCLDQTVGAAGNTLWFIVMINLLRGNGVGFIVETIRRVSPQALTWVYAGTDLRAQDFFPMIFAGYKFWPLITITNLVLVPVDQRMLVGGLAGLVWGIYVSLTQL